MFTAWLIDQIDDLGPQAEFGKVCWSDINNGCASTKFSASDWLHHFAEKHNETADKLSARLIVAFQEYKKEKTKEQ
jgi:hypothetical protein